MDHPSYGEPDEPDEEDDGWIGESALPEGITSDMVDDLIRQVAEATELVGLYADPMVKVQTTHEHDPDGECEKDFLILHFYFRIGDVAFTPRVQEPVQDEFNSEFAKIEHREVHTGFEAIKDRFRVARPKTDQP